MLLQVRNMLQEKCLMSQRNMIEQDQMLMQLPHIAYMRYNRDAELAAQKANGDKLAHPSYPYRIHLDKTGRTRLQIVLKNDPVGNMFAKGQSGRRNGL